MPGGVAEGLQIVFKIGNMLIFLVVIGGIAVHQTACIPVCIRKSGGRNLRHATDMVRMGMRPDNEVQMPDPQLINHVVGNIPAVAHTDLAGQTEGLRDTDQPSVCICNGIGIAVPGIHEPPAAVGLHQHQTPLRAAVHIHIEVIQPVYAGRTGRRTMPADGKQRRQHEEERQNMKIKAETSPHGVPLKCEKDSK